MNRFYNPLFAFSTGTTVALTNMINIFKSPSKPIVFCDWVDMMFWSAGKGFIYGYFYPLAFLNMGKDVLDKKKFYSHFIPKSKYV